MSPARPETSFRQILNQEFLRRRDRNAAYSLRAFARDINISPSRLCEVIGGKHRLSRPLALKISRSLGWNKDEAHAFCDLVDLENPRNTAVRNAAKSRVAKRAASRLGTRIKDEVFTFISDWHHAAIVAYQAIDAHLGDYRRLAAVFKIHPLAAQQAVERLERLGLIKPDLKAKDGSFVLSDNFICTSDDVPSEAIKKAHRQLLEKAQQALEQPFEQRTFDSLILAVDTARLPEAKQRLAEFYREFFSEFDAGATKTEVYCLSTQFFKLSEGTCAP